MDLGDPLGILKKKNKPSTFKKTILSNSDSEKQITYDGLKLVITDILKNHSKSKKRVSNSKMDSTNSLPSATATLHETRVSLNSQIQPSHEHLNNVPASQNPNNIICPVDAATNTNIYNPTLFLNDQNTFKPIDPEMISNTQPIDTMNDAEVQNILTNCKEELNKTKPQSVLLVPQCNDMEIHNNLDTDIDSEQKLEQSEDNSSTSCDNGIDTCDNNDSTSSDSDINVNFDVSRISRIKIQPSNVHANIHEFKTVINKLERKVNTSLKNERDRNSHKYKLLMHVKKIISIIKPPMLYIIGGVGVCFMLQSYSEMLILLTTNPTSAAVSLLFSAIKSVAVTFLR